MAASKYVCPNGCNAYFSTAIMAYFDVDADGSVIGLSDENGDLHPCHGSTVSCNGCGEEPHAVRQSFDVAIIETLKKVVRVEADSVKEAEDMVYEGYRNSLYVLGADDFAGYKISTQGR